MKSENSAIRLRKIMTDRNLKQVDILEMAKPYTKKYDVKLNKNDLSQYLSGKVEPGQHKLFILGLTLNVSEAWLMGYDVPMERTQTKVISPFPEPNITEDYATFKIIGNVAAGYNGIAEEQYDGDDIDIPLTYLRGRPQSDFFVLRVKGQSMYPEYRDGDIVLVLKTPTLEFSGDIGVVLYDGEMATLKKVEFVMGEDWMRLIPLNPAFETKTIKNEDLEQCQILGVPKLLIRPINNF